MLPEGLAEGEIVKVLDFDHGFSNVQCADGRKFHIAANCIDPVPSEFYGNHRVETFLKRIRSLFRSEGHRAGGSISTRFNYLRFYVLGDDEKPRGAIEIHKDAILNLRSEFRERIGRHLLALRARSFRTL